MRGLLAFGLVGVLFVGVSTAAGGKDDQAKLQGKWTAKSMNEKFTLTFTKDAFTFEVNGKGGVKGTFKLDPSKTPRHIDLMIKEGFSPDDAGKTAPGIYEVDGDTLKVCIVGELGKKDRPREFPEQEGEKGGQAYIIFKRAK